MFYLNQFLTYCSAIEVLPSAGDDSSDFCPPEGCAVLPISDACQAFMHLKGLVDTGKESERLLSKEEKIGAQLAKLKEAMAMADYETKVPEDVKTGHQEKLAQYTGELEKVTTALKALSTIG